MTTQANISNFKFYLGTTASPQVLAAMEEVISVSGVGKTNNLVDVTNFDSAAGTREFIAGLADGEEFTVECNYLPKATVQINAMSSVDSGLNKKAKLSYLGNSPIKNWAFDVVCMGYTVAPSATEQNRLTLTYKISGAIVRT